MAEEGKDDGNLPIIALDMVFENEATANAGDKNDAEHEAWRARNRARAVRRRWVNERMRSMHRELDAEFITVSERASELLWPTLPGELPYSSVTMIQTCVKHFAMRRRHGFSSINKTRRPRSEKNTWVKAVARLTVERQAAVLDLSAAITTTTLAGVRPLAGGNSHLQEATRDRPIIEILQKTCTSESMKDTMCDP
jgi:hypothetical protein